MLYSTVDTTITIQYEETSRTAEVYRHIDLCVKVPRVHSKYNYCKAELHVIGAYVALGRNSYATPTRQMFAVRDRLPR